MKLVIPLLLLAASSFAQRRPEMGDIRDPGSNRVEVRFALGDRTVSCRWFSLNLERGGRVLINGKFRSGFLLPADLSATSFDEKIRVQVTCGKQMWSFSDVPSYALRQGWWWIGTDYPPFQSEFGGDKFAKCQVIRYLISYPMKHEGFDYFETTPTTLVGGKGACNGK
jgi:hypothetical protein